MNITEKINAYLNENNNAYPEFKNRGEGEHQVYYHDFSKHYPPKIMNHISSLIEKHPGKVYVSKFGGRGGARIDPSNVNIHVNPSTNDIEYENLHPIEHNLEELSHISDREKEHWDSMRNR